MSILRKLKNKIVDDLIPNELKSPAGAIATAVALNQFGVPFTKGMGKDGARIGQGSISRGLASIFGGGPKETERVIMNPTEVEQDQADPIYKTVTKSNTLGNIVSGIGSVGNFLLQNPALTSIGAGLVAGAFSRKEDDPLYTGQSVGLNLRDIRKLANISDPRTGAAIGLNFLPETRFRQFSPEQMAETFAATAPKDFTEDRTPANNGGIMGDQKDFEDFLQDMKERDMGRMQDQILKDFEKFMERKRMIESLPEAKDGGIMRMANGGMMDMGGMEMDLRGGGFVPMGRAEKADDVPARLSKNEFVFTADAVRAAGGGSIDKGADKMYATMKALENKVA